MKTILFILCLAFNLYGQSVSVGWDKNTEPDLAGYRIFFGTDSTGLNQLADVGLGLTDPDDSLRIRHAISWSWQTKVRYFAGVKAYDLAGNVSDMSTIIGFEITDKTKPLQVENLRVIVTDANGNISVYKLVAQ